MTVWDNFIAVLTIVTSLFIVLLIIGTAWWLMWKVNTQTQFCAKKKTEYDYFRSFSLDFNS